MASTVIPALRYKDATAAIDFLVNAFGFTARMVIEGEGGTIEHAQLVHGTGMIMLGSDRDDAFGEHVRSDDGTSSLSLYVIVDDVAGHAATARAAGAEILMEPEEQDYGGGNYTARDLEGHVWSFGDYNPWADQS